MRPGDIVVFESNGAWWDFFIRLVSKQTHVGFAISSTEIIEANANGVIITKLSDCCRVHIRRIQGVNREQIHNGCQWAIEHLGERYSVPSAVIAGLMRMFNFTRKKEWFAEQWDCSEFVTQIIRKGMGIKVFEGINPEDVLPKDFLINKLFIVVEQ